MIDSIQDFYDELSEDYHLIYNNWDNSVKWQAQILEKIINNGTSISNQERTLLDCSCGIGTQAIGLAMLGYKVHATDLSPKAIDRADKESKRLGVHLTFDIADFRTLKKQIDGLFDVVISCDNALPHLLDEKNLRFGLENIRDKLKNNGLFLASIRDYDQLITERPKIMNPSIYDDESGRRIVFQVWDWEDNSNLYCLNLFIIRRDNENAWKTIHKSTPYRAVSKMEISLLLSDIGFSDVVWHMPEETGYYQPIVTAKNHKFKTIRGLRKTI